LVISSSASFIDLEILLDHFHFLLNHVDLRLNRLSQVIRRFLEPFDRFSDLPADLRQLLGAEQQKRDD